MSQAQIDAYKVKYLNCQMCSRSHHIAVHHIEFRSQAGSDEERNLISICDSFYGCRSHDRAHGKVFKKNHKGMKAVDWIYPWEFYFVKEIDME